LTLVDCKFAHLTWENVTQYLAKNKVVHKFESTLSYTHTKTVTCLGTRYRLHLWTKPSQDQPCDYMPKQQNRCINALIHSTPTCLGFRHHRCHYYYSYSSQSYDQTKVPKDPDAFRSLESVIEACTRKNGRSCIWNWRALYIIDCMCRCFRKSIFFCTHSRRSADSQRVGCSGVLRSRTAE